MNWDLLVLPAFLIWFSLILLPWRPWSTSESLDSNQDIKSNLSNLTVLIPARDEAAVIQDTLDSLADEDTELKVIVIDDQSTDDTVNIAIKSRLSRLKIVNGQQVPAGWSGKLWALEQGLQYVETDLILLLDADIRLLPGIIPVLIDKLENGKYDLVSLMAFLRMESFWEKLLMPAFIYFFKLIYPFQLSNSSSRYVAAAAGGCILLRKKTLQSIGNFESLKNCLIDDCALAKKIKNIRGKTWIGLTHSAISLRKYQSLRSIWDTVARTAFTQLKYSMILVIFCTLLMVCAFLFPVMMLYSSTLTTKSVTLITLFLMYISYLPILKYYSLNILWGWMLPVIGLIYIAMTWTSVYRHVFGAGSIWKDRNYSASG